MHVEALWRFPVKSMQGETLDEVTVDERGITGDRHWALLDRHTGLTLTARRVPQLLFAAARWRGENDVEIELPDGTVTIDDAELSEWLDRPVALRCAAPDIAGTYEIAEDFEDEAGSPWQRWDGPAGTFHDSKRARVSVVSTASMGQWNWCRFRANIIVDAAEVGAEDALVGHRVAAGSALLDVVTPIDRCVMTTRPQPGGIPRDLEVLRTINAERASLLGVGALVARDGRMRVGDELRVASGDAREDRES